MMLFLSDMLSVWTIGAPTLQKAFEQQVVAMFDYMTEINTIEVDPKLEPLNVFVEGHDLESLL